MEMVFADVIIMMRSQGAKLDPNPVTNVFILGRRRRFGRGDTEILKHTDKR